MGWLHFLGKRRPTSLADQGMYNENVSRPKAKPVSHDNPSGVGGTALGRGDRRTSSNGRKPKK